MDTENNIVSENLDPFDNDDRDKIDIIDLGNGLEAKKEVLLKAASFTRRKSYGFYGEVSFLLPMDKAEEKITTDHYEPLTFLRTAGFQRNQAKEILKDPRMFTNVYIVLKEARLFTQNLEHDQATLLYEAAVKIKRGRRAAEYIALVTDAVISGNVTNYEELSAFIALIDNIEDKKMTWDQIIPLNSKKETKNIPFMLHQYAVEKVFMDVLNLAKQLKERDDIMIQKMEVQNTMANETSDEKNKYDNEEDESTSSSEESEKSEQEIHTNEIESALLNARRPISVKEMNKQCCIFANYYDNSMYKYLPMVAHMIARGYFENHIQIEAVTDYLRPVCGMRPVKMTEILNIVKHVSTWKT